MMAGRTQVYPWASGKRKPAPKGKRPAKRKPAKRGSNRGLLAVVLSVVTLVLLVVALLTEAVLAWTVMGLSGVVAGIQIRAAAREAADQPARPRRQGGAAGGQQQGGAQVVCTKTGKPTDVCPCPERHVTSSDGAARYKLNIGDPIPAAGASKRPERKPRARQPRASREPRVPTTRRAQPIRPKPGEAMRRSR